MYLSLLWADYFDSQGVRYTFFSAANAVALQQARREALEYAPLQEGQQDDENHHEDSANDNEQQDHRKEEGETVPALTPPSSGDEGDDESGGSSGDEDYFSAEEDEEANQDPRARVLSVLELEDLLLKEAPPLSGLFTFYAALTFFKTKIGV